MRFLLQNEYLHHKILIGQGIANHSVIFLSIFIQLWFFVQKHSIIHYWKTISIWDLFYKIIFVPTIGHSVVCHAHFQFIQTCHLDKTFLYKILHVVNNIQLLLSYFLCWKKGTLMSQNQRLEQVIINIFVLI